MTRRSLRSVVDSVLRLVVRARTEVERLVAKIAVVVTAVNTYLVAFAAIAPLLATQVASAIPGPIGERAAAVILSLAGVATSVVLILRRSTEVDSLDRGLDPSDRVPAPASASPSDRQLIRSLRRPSKEELKRSGWLP